MFLAIVLKRELIPLSLPLLPVLWLSLQQPTEPHDPRRHQATHASSPCRSSWIEDKVRQAEGPVSDAPQETPDPAASDLAKDKASSAAAATMAKGEKLEIASKISQQDQTRPDPQQGGELAPRSDGTGGGGISSGERHRGGENARRGGREGSGRGMGMRRGRRGRRKEL